MTGYYDIPHANDAIAQRRASFGGSGGYGAAEPSGWSSPEGSQQTQAAPQQAQPAGYGAGGYGGGSNQVTGSVGSSGDSYLDMLHNSGMADALGSAYSARLHAMNASPNDPSMAAFAGLQSQIGGQSNAAHNLNDAGMQYAQQMRQHEWNQQQAELQHQWEMELQKSKNNAAMWQMGGQLLGAGITAAPSYAKTFWGWGGDNGGGQG